MLVSRNAGNHLFYVCTAPGSNVCITVSFQLSVFDWENGGLPGIWPDLFVYEAFESDEAHCRI